MGKRVIWTVGLGNSAVNGKIGLFLRKRSTIWGLPEGRVYAKRGPVTAASASSSPPENGGRLVDQPRGGRCGRVVRVEVDPDSTGARHTRRVTDDLAGKR